MRTKENLVHLDDICKEFSIVLADTSALVRPLNAENKGRNLIDRINSKKVERDSSVFFNKCLKKGNLYITKEIFKEYYGGKTPSIKEVFPKYNRTKLSKKEYRYYREICSTVKEKRNLLRTFKKNKKIISLDDFEKGKYNGVSVRNSYLKKDKGVGAVDSDLAIIGAVLSMARGKTAILSNDFPLMYFYQALLVNEHLSPIEYGFFLRINSDFFSRAKHTSNS